MFTAANHVGAEDDGDLLLRGETIGAWYGRRYLRPRGAQSQDQGDSH